MPGVLAFSFNIGIASPGSLLEVKESNVIVMVYIQYKVFSVMIMKKEYSRGGITGKVTKKSWNSSLLTSKLVEKGKSMTACSA